MRRVPGFVLDIDGLFIRGKSAIKHAPEALQQLNSLRFPYVFLTNGGGVTEAEKTKQLSTLLNVQVPTGRMILCHTPLQGLHQFRDTPVMVTGNLNCCSVARSYGFKKVINVAEFVQKIDAIYELETIFRKVPVGSGNSPLEFGVADIGAIFVMYDGMCWGSEMQVICDVLMESVLRTGKQTPLYFTNPDLTYSGAYHKPRIAAGAFNIGLSAIYKEITGRTLEYVQYGKPSVMSYEFAESVLRDQLNPGEELAEVYGIGDNQASDIRGANAREGWKSVLVKTGVYRDGDAITDHPDYIMKDIGEVLDFVREKYK